MKFVTKNALRSIAAPLLMTLAFASQPVLAQDARAQKIQARFDAADKDHDGKLTKTEAAAGMPRVAAYFDQIDADHTGFITLAQIKAFMQQHKK